MDLRFYLFATRTNQTDFAKKLGVSRGFLNLVINKRYKPSKTLALLIEAKTDGQVTYEEMLGEVIPAKKKAQK